MNRSTPLSGLVVVTLAAAIAAAAGFTTPRRAVAAGTAVPLEALQVEKARLALQEKWLDAQRSAALMRRPHRAPLVRPSGGSPPSSGSEVEANDTAATANPLTLNGDHGAIAAAINPGGDVDFFSFTANAGDKVWVHTDTGGIQNAGATSRDTVIDLIASDGSTVIENDDDDGLGNGCDGTVETRLASIIAGRTIPSAGTYYVRVQAFSATAIIDPYTLFVTVSSTSGSSEAENNDTPGLAQPLFFGSTAIVNGAIGVVGDVDYYALQVNAGATLSLVADADPERDGTGTDLVLDLFDTDGTTPLLSVDSSITGSIANPAAEGAAYTFATAGTYFLAVRHFSATGLGTYSLLVSGGACGLTCPANITVGNDPNQCGAVVTYPAPTTVGTCGTITCSPASGSFFPVGTTTITCSATSGVSCVFTVTVNDTQPATITCPANITVSNDPNQCGAVVNYPAPTVSDNCPGATTVCTPPSGSFFPLGTTTVTCTTTDINLNTASCSFTIRVNDTQPPTITCPANVTVFQDSAFGAVVPFTTTASDNCPGVTVTCSRLSGSVFSLGTTTVTCTATDGVGNTATCTFTVTVVPPPSTPGQVTASGSIRTAASRFADFRLDVRATGPNAVTGSVFFTDPQAKKTFRSTQVTALVISGNQARIFGKGIMRGRRTVSDFVIDVQDIARPGARKDTFRIETSDGYTTGPTLLTSGDVIIRRH